MKILMIIIAATLVLSCSKSTLRVTTAWYDEEKVKANEKKNSVFILALTPNVEVRQYLESDLAAAATAHNIKAVKSIEVLGMATTYEQFPKQEAIVKKVRDLNLESILTISLIHEQHETKYIPGTVYTPYSTYSYYGNFGGYYNYWGPQIYTEGYYQTDKTYFLESNLYDVATLELLLSIQSKASKPKSIEKASKKYTETLVDELHRKGLMKK